MGKIIILDESTVNRIAAGEVAERPASVIKELVENSIDAGSSVISTEIRNGGISFIRVIDNGTGMPADDVEMAFERHATSKIRRADDLGSITSMGFRGEALASIAAVSEVQLLTRTRDSVQGVFITVKGGSVIAIKPAGCPSGTSITVRELFFNTPARYKFLKKDTTEAGYITDILSRIALSHSDISFTLVNNGKKVLHTPGNSDLKSTVFSIYGAETAKQLLEVDYADENIKITGFVGKAEISRSNRTHQSIYINKRYIRNKTITSAIDNAYSTFLMKNRYPFILLNISINPLNVDVNVHPSKMEVKFSNEHQIFRAVYHAVNNALLSRSSVRTLPGSYSVDENNYTEDIDSYGPDKRYENGKHSSSEFRFSEKSSGKPSYTQQEFEWVKRGLDEKREAAISGKKLDDSALEKIDGSIEQPCGASAVDDIDINGTIESSDKYDSNEHTDKEIMISESHNSTYYQLSAGINEDNRCSENASLPVVYDDRRKNSQETVLFDNAKIIGQIFSTYILLEGEDEVFLLDQHAAHERIRYEKLKDAYCRNEPFSQMLMSVINVDLTSSEYQFAMSETKFFNKLGFSFESFGENSLILRSAPLIDGDFDIKGGFLDILDFVMNESSGEKSLIADEALYRMACRSAVKAHKKLNDKEIDALLAELSSLDNPYTCPHGRPAIFKLRRYDLEKLFKRIV